jgi:membrane protein required for colicin V production
MENLNALDFALLGLLGLLALLGLIKGLTRLAISVVALVAAFLLAAHFHEPVAEAIAARTRLSGPLLMLVAYLSIFLGTMLAGALAGFIARKLVQAALLSWIDRLAGAAVGLVAATLLAALIVLPVVAYWPAGSQALENSVLAPYLAVVADMANRFVPEKLSAQYRKGVEALRRHWRERWAAADARAV